jgi:ribulose-5-phosphate 4-epimerase/fuculose-1-phosphate aldolase
MKRLLDIYIKKMIDQGLAAGKGILFLGIDAELVSNRPAAPDYLELAKVFGLMNINSLLYAEPAEPYLSIIRFLSEKPEDRLTPSDCETRTFLHDIPVIPELSAAGIVKALSRRKAAIVRGKGVISYGTVSPEQAFVSFSSVCFSTFIKFFTDVMFSVGDCRRKKASLDERVVMAYEKIINSLSNDCLPEESAGAVVPETDAEIYNTMIITGKRLVGERLVDSYFGNISYVHGNTIYISQTGSSMDNLETCIDAVPLDGSSSAGITASSELSAHIGIYNATGKRAIIHGHPKFTVIQSMSCREEDCDLSTCYKHCRKKRSFNGIPVVSGEIGTGPAGIARTVPEAIVGRDAVIVYGHGIFAAGAESFREAFEAIRAIEQNCREEYLRNTSHLLSSLFRS